MVIIKHNTISGYMVRTLKKLRAQADRPEFKFEPWTPSWGILGRLHSLLEEDEKEITYREVLSSVLGRINSLLFS